MGKGAPTGSEVLHRTDRAVPIANGWSPGY